MRAGAAVYLLECGVVKLPHRVHSMVRRLFGLGFLDLGMPTEKFIRALAGEHLADGVSRKSAHKIVCDGGPHQGRVKGLEVENHLGQNSLQIIQSNDHLMVFRIQVARHLPCTLEVRSSICTGRKRV